MQQHRGPLWFHLIITPEAMVENHTNPKNKYSIFSIPAAKLQLTKYEYKEMTNKHISHCKTLKHRGIQWQWDIICNVLTSYTQTKNRERILFAPWDLFVTLYCWRRPMQIWTRRRCPSDTLCILHSRSISKSSISSSLRTGSTPSTTSSHNDKIWCFLSWVRTYIWCF